MTDIIGKAYPLGDAIGFVELLDHMGNDLTVVNAARVSLARESHELSPRDKRLIHFLMANRHSSPFEHAVMSFRVKAPIFVVRHWERHRWSSFNEQSGRWTAFEPEFYCPTDTIREFSKEAFTLYEHMLTEGVEKEEARLVLPPNLYTTFWYTANALSLMNFIGLRNASGVQEETRLYAKAVEDIFEGLLPEVHAAFTENGRRAQ